MRKKTFVGDVHGKFAQYKRILKNSVYPTVQVGDMGVGFRKLSTGMGSEAASENPPHRKMGEKKALFIRGNHDNLSVCRNHSQWIKDGHTDDGVMYIGGAKSTDIELRHEGYDYWSDEELDNGTLYDLVDKYVEYKPEVMVTHDCPRDMGEIMENMSERRKLHVSSRTRDALSAMFSFHKPKLWIFGHWHFSADYVLNGTRFVCLAELETKDFELP